MVMKLTNGGVLQSGHNESVTKFFFFVTEIRVNCNYDTSKSPITTLRVNISMYTRHSVVLHVVVLTVSTYNSEQILTHIPQENLH